MHTLIRTMKSKVFILILLLINLLLVNCQTYLNKQDQELLLKGKIKTGPIDFDYLNLLNYNDYEGFRFQLGGITNNDFNSNFFLDSYAALSTKDPKFKWGAGVGVYLDMNKEKMLHFSFNSDVETAGQRTHKIKPTENLTDRISKINNNLFYDFNQFKLSYQQKIGYKLIVELLTQTQTQKAEFNYSYLNNNLRSKYDLFESSLKIQYSPFLKYIDTRYGKVTISDHSPEFFLNYTKDWNMFTDGFNFHELDLAIDYYFFNFLGKTSFSLKGGVVFGNTSLLNLYDGMGGAKKGKHIGDRLGVKGFQRFETMSVAQFFSDRYFSFFITHQLMPFWLLGKPILFSFVYNGLIGEMNHKDYHHLYNFEIPNKYYQEAGIELNNILGLLGFGAYYRLGTYHSGDINQDLFIKFILKFPL